METDGNKCYLRLVLTFKKGDIEMSKVLPGGAPAPSATDNDLTNWRHHPKVGVVISKQDFEEYITELLDVNRSPTEAVGQLAIYYTTHGENDVFFLSFIQKLLYEQKKNYLTKIVSSYQYFSVLAIGLIDKIFCDFCGLIISDPTIKNYLKDLSKFALKMAKQWDIDILKYENIINFSKLSSAKYYAHQLNLSLDLGESGENWKELIIHHCSYNELLKIMFLSVFMDRGHVMDKKIFTYFTQELGVSNLSLFNKTDQQLYKHTLEFPQTFRVNSSDFPECHSIGVMLAYKTKLLDALEHHKSTHSSINTSSGCSINVYSHENRNINTKHAKNDINTSDDPVHPLWLEVNLNHVNLGDNSKNSSNGNSSGGGGGDKSVPELELATVNVPIVMVDTCLLLDKALELLSQAEIIGLDVEYAPGLVPGFTKNSAAIVQLGISTQVFLIDVYYLPKEAVVKFINTLFGTQSVKIIGFGIRTDLQVLDLLVEGFSKMYKETIIDLEHVQRDIHILMKQDNTYQVNGLSNLAKFWLSKSIDKTNQQSNWIRRPLRPQQVSYAALDAYVLLELFCVMDGKLKQLIQLHGDVPIPTKKKGNKKKTATDKRKELKSVVLDRQSWQNVSKYN